MSDEDQLCALLTRLRDKAPPARGLIYCNAADFVLTHGVWFTPGPWRPEWERGAPRLCFGNSILWAAWHGWKYWEGFALHPAPLELAIHHAWNTLPDGTLLDSTWCNTGRAYVGVEFSLGRADTATWDGDANVLDDRHRGHPLFRQEWRGEDFSLAWPPSPALAAIYRHKEGIQQ